MTQKPHFSVLATSFAGGPPPRRTAIILYGLWLLVFFAALFTPPLLDDADATHAQAARAMVTTGDLVTLHVDGIRYLEKAPLPYWGAALSMKLFGFNTFAAHLPQALAVLLLMLLGYRWANQAFGSRTGFYTALGILTSTGVFLFTRILIPEIWLSLFLGAALFAFLKSLGPIAAETIPPPGTALERPSIAWYAGPLFYPYVMWASLACAVLSKGLVALVFFGGTTLFFLALTGDWRKWRLLRPFTGLLLFLAIAAPWHILAGLRNTGGADGHGFFWFYFWNEHVLRFLGKRIPMDYNKMPGWLFWTSHLIWLFPWTLFLPLGLTALWRRYKHQLTLTQLANTGLGAPGLASETWDGAPTDSPRSLQREILKRSLERHLRSSTFRISIALFLFVIVFTWRNLVTDILLFGVIVGLSAFSIGRRAAGLTASPFHRIDPQQRTILLLSLFAGLILLFFSLSTNQEYYTFPAYLPILLLIAATITRAEQTYSSNPSAQRWITFAHAAFTTIGAAVAIALVYGLWSSRHIAFVPDIGALLAHRGVGNYTLSMSHLFDLTTASFAGLRLPAVLAAFAFAFGPAAAWMLRMQRRHLAATTCIAFTIAAFLIAAQLAFARFAPMLSSHDLAEKIVYLSGHRANELTVPPPEVMLYGDQAFGSSIPFYLGEQVELVNGRSTSMLFGSAFPDAPKIFLTDSDLRSNWGRGSRKLLFVPAEQRDHVDKLLGAHQFLIQQTSGKALITDRPLSAP